MIQVYSWGCNDDKCLGQTSEREWKPALVTGFDDEEVIQVDGGDSHSAAVTSTGKVYTWGLYRDNEGAMRISESEESRSVPGVVEGADKVT